MLDAILLLIDKSKSSLFQAQRKRLEKILRENRVGAGKRREGGAFKHHCCQCLIPVTSSWYTLWLVNFDSLRQHLRQSLGFARRVNKRGELVKPYYTAHFHILTFLSFLVFWHEKRFCGSGRGNRRTQSASSPVVLGDFGCDVTCQACRSRSVPSLLWWFE